MKKLVMLALAAMLVVGMTSVGFAKASGKITGVIEDITSEDYEGIEVEPGEIIKIPLTADMFDWSSGDPEVDEPVSKSQLSSSNVTVKAKYSGKSSKYVKTVEFDTGKFDVTDKKSTAYIKIEFTKDIDVDEPVDFEFYIYLSVKGSKKSQVNFSGTIERSYIWVDDDEDFVDISSGQAAKAESYLKDVEFYIGNGVSIKGKMFEDKAYYGTCTEGITSADEKVVEAYPEMDNIYRIDSNITSGKVVFDLDQTYHVYDEDGYYVGTTDKALDFSKVYYLATKKIAMGDSGSSNNSSNNSSKYDDDDDDDEIYYDIEDDDDGPSYTYNPNDNPSTGSKGIAGAVVLAGLATVAIVLGSRKKLRR